MDPAATSSRPGHVALIGFMCSGKSTVGRLLAPLLGLPFRDLDRVIEERVGPLTPFFQREGEEAFRALEREVLAELLSGPPVVLSTGGGTPMSFDNMERLRAGSTTVWLDVPLADLMPRIVRAGGDRPLLFGLKGDELHARVGALLAQREGTYAEADIIVQASGPPAVVADHIARALRVAQSR
jgi:shikimate kinase